MAHTVPYKDPLLLHGDAFSHLRSAGSPEEAGHHVVQLLKLLEGVADISVEVLVLLVLVVERSLVPLPLLSRGDFWVLPGYTRGQ